MSESPRALMDGTYWFGGALGAGAVGLILGFLAILGPGLGVSGSGCGSGCQSTSELFTVLAMLALAASFVAAAASVALIWRNRQPTSSAVAGTVITIVNVVIMLVSGACFAFMASL